MILEVTTKNVAFLEAIASETRIKIIEMLNEKPMNIKELAAKLGISSAITTRHVQQLEQAGIIKSESNTGVRGIQKVCHLQLNQVTLLFRTNSLNTEGRKYIHSIPVGQYTAFKVNPTCGLASESKIIGVLDDPRYFDDPEHTHARLLWFSSGWIEYRIPNMLLHNQKIKSLRISLEICAEAPGFNENWPSDITFSINGKSIGLWTCPGDFGSTKGALTPEWWAYGTQYGLLKTISVQENGTYLDGIHLSETTVADLQLTRGKEIILRIASAADATNPGGISLFGKGFGNYNQDIEVTIEY